MSNDLPSVGTENALKVADLLPAFEIAGLGKGVAADACDMLRALVSERDALAVRVAELEAERDAAAETACGAVRKAFSLGQTYWQQADSEYSSQHRKAEDTWAKFKALVEETRATLSTTPESKP